MTEHRALAARLDEVAERLDRLWSDPESIRHQASWLSRVWLRVSGAGRGVIIATAALARVRGEDAARYAAEWSAHRRPVVGELEGNVERLERSARVHGEAPAPVLSWLFGVHRWVVSMEDARRLGDRHADLALRRGLASRALLGPPPDGEAGAMIALAGVDALLNEAAQETERLARRRQLLESARRLLLEADAEAPAPSGEARRALIAEELVQLDRIAAAGVDPHVALSHQLARSARRGLAPACATASAALAYLRAGAADPVPEAARALAATLPSGAPSTSGVVPRAVEDAVERGYRRAREACGAAIESAGLSEVLALRRQRQYLSVDAHLALLRMALGVDGVFDVGGRLERERVEIEAPTAEAVPFPTPELELHPVREPDELRHAVIEDPRLVLYHLASRRLLRRRYVHRAMTRRRGAGVRAAVRFYLLDGSTSMQGARARMRDAILVAELASLVSRLERPGQRIRSLLYYRYFNSEADVTRRIATVAEALEAIEQVLGAMRTGRTDIEGALMDSLDLIARNRDNDVALSRAQIVLVTDGAAPVDPEMIARAQARLDIPVRVSVILLGDDNPQLRQLAAEQRAAGLRVLYHHVRDERLAEVEGGWDEAEWPSFTPGSETVAPPQDALDELAALDRGAPSDGVDGELLDGLRAVGLGPEHLDEAARARIELSRRDLRALSRRFDRLFPRPARAPESVHDRADEEVTVVLDALAVVSEVLALGASDEASAMHDAVAILVRLLRERGLTPERYLTLTAEHADLLAPAIHTVRAQASARRAS